MLDQGQVAGLDGCRGRWLCVMGDPQCPETIRALILENPGDLLRLDPRPQVVGADIPIGLADTAPRRADREARQRLGRPRGSSVFPAPLRVMMKAPSYEQACLMGRQQAGRALSRQAWNIIPMIRAMDDFLQAGNDRQAWVREVHPELSFQAWNQGLAMTHNKKTPVGRQERHQLVEATFPGAYEAACSDLVNERYAPDDLLDAFAVFWTAARIAQGRAIQLPEMPEKDATGLRMEIMF
ncbi:MULTISPECIES: DUF429 domain-containing protein [unclassified Ectothiorhodospira]|uniref:DUF429 domain-containing protein n=1 Tax=unclassified Ectothiorhodospira TaxID=2684909 RepID=UPI001EE92749|nr:MULTISPECIES: DUF429 domain-containing protein [unclassified Ectothiorhodospira]MCG5516205.1 DUF429 domain-containing protein [Ectothiorhodospira sp. 9100]MCG5519642.1 DUF429 domain-containing protein [Ectothiorhodospira sp. 9905]